MSKNIYLLHLQRVFCGLAINTILIVGFFSLGATYTFVGVLFSSCPIEENLRIWLLTKGACYLCLFFTRFYQVIFHMACPKTHQDDNQTNDLEGRYVLKESRLQISTIMKETVRPTQRSKVITSKSENDDLVLTREITVQMNNVTLLECIILVFLITWFIIGFVWIHRIKDKVQFRNASDKKTFCEEKLYQTSSWSTLITIVIGIASLCVLIITLLVTLLCFSKKKQHKTGGISQTSRKGWRYQINN